MLIAQITDLHIGPSDSARFNDARLAQLVDKLTEIGPDLVLATGDLSEGGSASSYGRLNDLLAPVQAPILPVIGNHDHSDSLLAAFDLPRRDDGFVQYAVEIGDLRIIVLDTTERGLHGGAFCEQRAVWLRACLDERPATPTLIALHHPPVRTGIAWMDENAEGAWSRRLGEVLDGAPQVLALVAGHIHRPLATQFAGRPLIIAPSSAPQVVLDLGPREGDGTRSLVPRIIAEDPGFALHLWTGGRLVSHFGVAADPQVLASYDVASRRIVPS